MFTYTSLVREVPYANGDCDKCEGKTSETRMNASVLNQDPNIQKVHKDAIY